ISRHIEWRSARISSIPPEAGRNHVSGPAMIAVDDALGQLQAVLEYARSHRGSGRDVLGAEVLTDAGTALGAVVDVIVEVGDAESRRCDVVGYGIESYKSLGHCESHSLRARRPGWFRRRRVPCATERLTLMRFSAAVGRRVAGTDAADTVGQVAGFVVDPAGRRVLTVQVKKSGSGTALPWSNIGTFGNDAVIVRAADAIGEPDGAIAS
ncbi:PRC-barrel domain-containing protein, partial [Rhodococcus marinonascens]|uniref:PRC-barrel domain-containing protein n=1 Tax=Rhodococcus marinonascens TaxID=38311 RepID=UPI000A8413B5